MKLLTAIPSVLAFEAPTLTCLHVYGHIAGDPFLGASVWSVFAVDNGQIVCSSDMGARIDQDGHFSMGCLPGYIYAFTKDGKTAWFANPSQAWSWIQPNHPDTYDCYGACDDKEGLCIKCTDYNWDLWEFC
jgi:hypothetical protein